MSGSSEYFIRALELVRSNREKAETAAGARKQKLYFDLPELHMLDMQISSVFADAVKKQLAGVRQDFDIISKQSLLLQQHRADLLKDAGIDESLLLPEYKCKKCEDTGYVNGKMCDCVRTIASKMIYDEINRDVPLEKSTFDSFNLSYYPDKADSNGVSLRDTMKMIKMSLQKYADSFTAKSKSLLFYGETGLGKTHLSLAIANDVIAKGYNVVYAPISRIMQQIEDEHFSREKVSNQTLNSIISCDLLIIDDLGTEFTTPFVTSTIYDIINSRVLSSKPTIINTNLYVEELEKKYTPRVVSRITGNYKLFKFVGNDVRALLNLRK